MEARIYQPTKTAMQSGRARTRRWVLQFDAEAAREVEPLMGWTASADMRQQVHLSFATKDEAMAYAERHHIPFRTDDPQPRRLHLKTYADNFR